MFRAIVTLCAIAGAHAACDDCSNGTDTCQWNYCVSGSCKTGIANDSMLCQLGSGAGKCISGVCADHCKTSLSRNLFDIWWKDVIAMAVFFVCSGFAVAAGIGGGGLFVPTMIILLQFDDLKATSTSQAMVAGAALSGLLLNLKQRHPKADRPLIDMTTVLLCAPVNMAGALCGVSLSVIIPNIVLKGLMVVVFSWACFTAFTKGAETYKKDKLARTAPVEESYYYTYANRNRRATEETEMVVKGEQQCDARTHRSEGHESHRSADARSTREYAKEEVDELRQTDECLSQRLLTSPMSPTTPMGGVVEEDQEFFRNAQRFMANESISDRKKWIAAIVVWLITLCIILINGGKTRPSLIGLKRCTGPWFGFQGLAIAVLIFLSLLFGRSTINYTQQRVQYHAQVVAGDVAWTWPIVVAFLAYSYVSGIISAIIGVGGGMIIGPFLLARGFLPQVSASCTTLMVVLTSSCTAVAFIVGGVSSIDYCATYSVICFMGGFVGKYKIDKIVKQYKLTSLLIFLLGFIMVAILISVIFVTMKGIICRDWAVDLAFHSPC